MRCSRPDSVAKRIQDVLEQGLIVPFTAANHSRADLAVRSGREPAVIGPDVPLSIGVGDEPPTDDASLRVEADVGQGSGRN